MAVYKFHGAENKISDWRELEMKGLAIYSIALCNN